VKETISTARGKNFSVGGNEEISGGGSKFSNVNLVCEDVDKENFADKLTNLDEMSTLVGTLQTVVHYEPD